MAVQSLKELGRVTYRSFLELFKQMVDSLDEWSARRKAKRNVYVRKIMGIRKGSRDKPNLDHSSTETILRLYVKDLG
jgi:hypothetical protein